MSSRVLPLALVTVLACSGDTGKEAGEEEYVPLPLVATLAGETAGMRTPESARYDGDQDVFFISNIDGGASDKDGKAFIAVVPAETLSVMRVFVEGGRNGVTLNAPKGMALQEDTLWVTDIDAVRGFNRRTGAPVRSFDLSSHEPTFLNDIAVGPNGALYVTDSNIRFEADGSMAKPGVDRIFRISNGIVTEVAHGEALGSPNGITWQDTTGTWLLAPEGKEIQTWTEGDPAPKALISGAGSYDGIEALRDGRILVSSWADSAVHIIHGREMKKLISNVNAPADIGYDLKRGVVAVPLFNDGKVAYYQLKEAK